MPASLKELLESVVRKHRASLHGSAGSLDAAGLDAIGSRVARDLAALGVMADEPVLLPMGNRPADVGALLGVWRAGAVAVPVSASAPVAVLSRLRGQVRARFTITPDGAVVERDARAPRSIGQGAALVVFTSGSTGQPKGVIVSHERFASKIAALQRLLPLRGDDVVLVPLQLIFIFGLWVSLLGLLAGARVLLMPRFSVSGISQAFAEGASVAGVVPTMLQSLPADALPAAPALRLLLTGGEPLGATLAARISAVYPRAGICDLYGSTETGSCDFCLRASDPAQFGAIGTPTEGVEYRIVDEAGRPVAPGEPGDLQIRTPYVMLGYLDAPDLTAVAFDGEFFRTGDLARLRTDGLVELAGRRKDIITRGGVKIAPLEIDQLFAAHPDVEAALCGGVPDARLGEAVHVLIVRRNGVAVDAGELRDWAAERIERVKLPDAIHFVDELPVGGTGKVDRGAIARLVAAKSR